MTTPVSSSEPMRVGGDVSAPIAIKRIEPNYKACEGQKIWGFPILEAVIDEKGLPTRVRMLSKVHPCLEKIVTDAVRQWRFKPATCKGKPVAVMYNVTVFIRWQ